MRELYLEHVGRLERDIGAAVAGAGFDAAVFHAGAESLRSPFDDQMWPFISTPAFAHWLPLAEPGCAVVLRPGERPRLHRPVVESYWDAPPPDPEPWVLEPFEVRGGDIELGAGRVAFVGDDAGAGLALGLEHGAINPPPLIAALDAVRAIKSSYEIECIAAANRVAANGHAGLAEMFADAIQPLSELDLYLLYLVGTKQDDADTPYRSIVALDRNAAVLHHVRYQRTRSEPGPSSLLVDAGARVAGYAADVTRTAVKTEGDAAARRFAELIDAMDALQRRVCARIEPGLSFERLHDYSHELLGELLRDLELATAGADELVESGVTRAFFPHGLGHSIGVQVHDVGCRLREPAARNPYLRHTAEIAEGHVFTIEPGLYFIDSLLDPLRQSAAGATIDWNLVGELHRFGGIRIEDNVAVAPGAVRNLTREGWPAAN
jgi:Xaa-Pro dipeptidase